MNSKSTTAILIKFQFVSFFLSPDVSKWTGAQLRRLGSLINGLSKEEILKITKNSFKDMIGSCAHFTSLNGDVLKALATRAKQVHLLRHKGGLF